MSAQQLLIDTLHAQGRDTETAEALLLTLEQTLRAWQNHRELILQAIARLENGPPLQDQT